MSSAPKQRQSFRFRVTCGPKLTEIQFREMVRYYLCLECSGLMCNMYSDWDKETQGVFWDTDCWDASSSFSPAPERVKESLLYFAKEYLRKASLPYNGNDISEYVTCKLSFANY